MSAPVFTHMANRYRSPRPYNNQSRPYGKHPHSGFQWRPRMTSRPNMNFATASNDEHWCETCDRGFPTADILDKHKQQHQKCNIDGCQFVAHPKVITKHIQMQHSSGLYKKISKLDNPEEIQKWREERKKKYPTRINIEKKAAEHKEKIERGEKMALKENRHKIDKSTDNPTARKRTHDFHKNIQSHRINKSNHNQQNIPSSKDKPPARKFTKVIPNVPSVVHKNKLLPFTGILSISMDDETVEDVNINSNNVLIEEDEYNEDPPEQPVEKVIQEPTLCGALTSLMCDYGSSDEENGEKDSKEGVDITITTHLPNVDKLSKNIETKYNNNLNSHVATVNRTEQAVNEKEVDRQAKDLAQTNRNDDNSDNDSGPEEVKTIKINVTEPTSIEIPKPSRLPINAKKNLISRNDNKQNNRYKHKVPSTLLQKLLYKEIRKERNIVLQCIRYIKKMNYFEKPHE